jgi:CubicO group peptidase (beta-lactamase class C family)
MTAKLQPSPAEKTVALFKDRPLDFAPGSQMSYSNSGYVLLGYLVEKISGQSYAAFLRDNVFTPLGMKDTGYDVNADIIERRAAGYTPSAKGFQNAPFVEMTIPGGAGALYSTTEDMLRWTRGLFGGNLLTSASVTKMTTPFKNNYAFGLVSSQRNGRMEISHSGGIEGFNTKLIYYPADKTTIVVLANVNGPAADQIADQLAAVYYGVSAQPATRNEVKVPSDVLAGYAGVYPLASNFTLTMTVVDGALISRATGQPDVPLYAEAKDRFFARAVDATIEFARGADGKVNGLTLRQGGQELHASRQ